MTTSAEMKKPVFNGSAAWLALPFLFCVLSGCGTPGPTVILLEGPTMGTTYHVKVVGDLSAEETGALGDAIAGALDAVNSAMSTYKDDSELSRFNASQSTEPFPLSSATIQVLDIALRVGEQSGGAFDVTVGPLVNAYGFGPEERESPPTDAEIAVMMEQVGAATLLRLDNGAGTLQKLDHKVYVDLSAVAKGYGVDKVAEVLDARGMVHYMVEVGGEVRTRGLNPAGQPWQIAIEKPIVEGRAIERIVPLADMSMATSGDYRNYYEEDGVRISHTIDARTGKPITHTLASVSVLHPECAWADAYATAINVLGPEAGYDFAVTHDLPVVLLIHDGEGFAEKVSPAFEKYLTR